MRWIKFIFLLSIGIPAAAQNPGAVDILKKVQDTLRNLKDLTYHMTRQTSFNGTGYDNTWSADLYIDYTDKNPAGFRFIANGDMSAFVYDGSTGIYMHKGDRTIDSYPILSAEELESNLYLPYSLPALRLTVPTMIMNDSVQRKLSDTVINNRSYYNIRVEGPQMSFGHFNGVARVDTRFRLPHYLIIDKETYLPYQLLSGVVRNETDSDFIVITYSNINTHPQKPEATKWDYAAYAVNYKTIAPRKLLVSKGQSMPGFTLLNYTPQGVDSISLAQYAGKVVLVDFWFKRCGYCIAAMPKYNALQEKFGKDGFQLLTVNIMDPVEDVKLFYDKFKPNYKMLMDGHELFAKIGFMGCPSAVLVDKNGNIAQFFEGFVQGLVEKKIQEVLNLP